MEAKGASAASRALAGVSGDVSWKREVRSSPGCGWSSSSTTTTTPGTTSTLSTPSTNTPDGCLTPVALPADGLGLDPILGLSSWWICEDSREEKLELVKRLFHDFCVANGDASVLELWFPVPEMAAGDADATSSSLLQFAGSWIRALTDTAEGIRKSYHAAMFSVPDGGPAHVQLARFTRAFILKMSPFVDAMVAPCLCSSSTGGGGSEIVVVADGGARTRTTAADKLLPLLGVRDAVSRASQDIRLSLCSTWSLEAKRITDETASLLSSKEGELDEAIWSIIQEVRARLLPSMEDDDGSWWGAQILRGSSSASPEEVHQVTRGVVSYISLLSANCTTMHQILGQFAAGYVPTIDSMSPLNSLIMETVSCLDGKLAENSRSFTDQSLRFLFLINNSYFIWQHLYPTNSVPEVNKFLEGKIDNYVETYLQVSWAPVLSCLCNSTPLCFGDKNYSILHKFESQFQKTYNAQKLWKVPDPKLRRRLRVAVVEKVVSSFTKYLEYNDISPSRITPHDLMDMLQELFEG